MEILKSGWYFFQNEILGMQWLSRLIGSLLNSCGLNTKDKIGGSVQFFLRCSDFAYFVYSELFPAGKNKENSWKISRYRS